MSFLGSETFFNPKLHRQTRKSHPLSLTLTLALLPKNTHICSHFLPPRAASETITADAMQGGGGSRREGFLSSPDPAASLVLPQLLLSLFFFFFPSLDPKTPQPASLISVFMIHIHLLTSCTNVPLVLDHCVLIAGLARYVGQATWRGAGRGAQGGVALYQDQSNFQNDILPECEALKCKVSFPQHPSHPATALTSSDHQTGWAHWFTPLPWENLESLVCCFQLRDYMLPCGAD